MVQLSKVLLRIASVLMLLHSVGHISGLITWQKSIPPDVVQKMQEVHYRFMYKDGLTMADFYTGASVFGVILIVFIAVLLWMLSDSKDKLAVRLLWTIAIVIGLHAAVELIYFFPIALIFCVISAVLVLIAIFQIKKSE